MPILAAGQTSAPANAQIECSTCERSLPLRLTQSGENAALWLCSRCKIPYVAFAIEEELKRSAHAVRLDERYFDVTALPEISVEQRQEVAKIAHREVRPYQRNLRRSRRIAQSLVVPAVRLGPGFVPEDEAFKILVANLSREGIGLVHDQRIDAEYIALELSPQAAHPIQVIVRLVRQANLDNVFPYVEIGGEFHIRLGSVASE